MRKGVPFRKVTVAGVVTTALLALGLVFAPESQAAGVAGNSGWSDHHQGVLVGVGDSFTSGEGNPPFIAGTDTPVDQCHRSLAAYPFVAARMLGVASRDVACSGATTGDLFATYNSEQPQVDSLRAAKYVVTTIGGNDIGALQAVANPTAIPSLVPKLPALEAALIQTYTQLRSAAPGATVFAVGYPNIVGVDANVSCPFSASDRAAVIQGEGALDDTIQAAAVQAGIGYVDTSSAFGGHELCTTDPWINGLDQQNPEYSLHPTAAGQYAMAQKVASAIGPKHCRR